MSVYCNSVVCTPVCHYAVNIGKCDVDENDELPGQFGVRNIPTVLFIKNGEVVDKQVGATTKAALKEKIEALLK